VTLSKVHTLKVAHFLQTPELVNSPPNDAIVRAYQELGVSVDIYAPTKPHDSNFRLEDVCYSYQQGWRWLLTNTFSPRWRSYHVISGTCEDAMLPVGVLGFFHRIPTFTLADEIRSGSYSGNKSDLWKRLCRWAMRRGEFTIVNDECRVELQRKYAGMPKRAKFMVFPGCFAQPPSIGDRNSIRMRLGIPPKALTIAFSGTFNLGNGALWAANLLGQLADAHVLGQITGADPLVKGLLMNLQGANRLHLEAQRLTWTEAWSSIVAADIGMVVYLQDGPQFQNMGISSNRLCMFLAMGVPVIASRQPSFQFVEDYDCGILVDNEAEFIGAVDHIRGRLETMKDNALRCAREYIDAPGKYLVLRDAIAKLIGRDPGEPLT